VPESVFAMFQLTFAIITCALVVGALVERMHFGALLLFAGLWLLLVYAPIAHWVWEPGGWLAVCSGYGYAATRHFDATYRDLANDVYSGRLTAHNNTAPADLDFPRRMERIERTHRANAASPPLDCPSGLWLS
jgi:ammonia channel protein AmtB